MSDDMPRKMAGLIPISNEMLISAPLDFAALWASDTRTPEQREADNAKRRKAAREKRDKIRAEHAALLAQSTGLRFLILELHEPEFFSNEYDGHAHCDGCDLDGYEVEAPIFPCRTYTLAANWEGDVSGDEEPTSDPLGIIDGLMPMLEAMRGAVALFVRDGFTEEQARALVVHLFTQRSTS